MHVKIFLSTPSSLNSDFSTVRSIFGFTLSLATSALSDSKMISLSLQKQCSRRKRGNEFVEWHNYKEIHRLHWRPFRRETGPFKSFFEFL